MTDVSRPLYRALLVAGLVATVFTAGCKKKPVPAAPPPPPPVEQPKPQPTVTLSANPTSINKGESSTMSWSSTNATQLTIAPEVGTVTTEGHCDERGSTEYNLALGDRRAGAVKQYLVSLGISADRMTTFSFGKEKPFCNESNETCWQQNRRGHFVRAQ